MRRYGLRLLPLIVVAIASAGPLAASAQSSNLPVRENDEGGVTVTVTPLELSSSAEGWRFAVQFNTHVAPITQDLAAVSTLDDGKGRSEPATAWQGDPPGGHHIKGVLLFKAMTPPPETVTLIIHQVGSVPERRFVWTLTNP